eukprot:CAMPEP_0202095922 /NCGR_PEP_ID=MMETSP0965-20130614/319_1 /ASSEMBLY_ACC=CAM_ASM_000507 /TAXON_ID=4773 /ORGANISM="Schizochytrium aggregatum, Strain ATCC28209" /LENGTH=150 /DNA_ID=CAMNT_0048664225 /DNA_START=190 /DNA_END=639 /DNA_ORIENTATION=-
MESGNAAVAGKGNRRVLRRGDEQKVSSDTGRLTCEGKAAAEGTAPAPEDSRLARRLGLALLLHELDALLVLVVLALLIVVALVAALEREVASRLAAAVERDEEAGARVARVDGELGGLHLLDGHLGRGAIAAHVSLRALAAVAPRSLAYS